MIGSFVGAVFSGYATSQLLLAVFAGLALVAASLMFFPVLAWPLLLP
jgi:hypothetical protein